MVRKIYTSSYEKQWHHKKTRKTHKQREKDVHPKTICTRSTSICPNFYVNQAPVSPIHSHLYKEDGTILHIWLVAWFNGGLKCSYLSSFD